MIDAGHGRDVGMIEKPEQGVAMPDQAIGQANAVGVLILRIAEPGDSALQAVAEHEEFFLRAVGPGGETQGVF